MTECARISDLIFEESYVMLANGHARDAISDSKKKGTYNKRNNK